MTARDSSSARAAAARRRASIMAEVAKARAEAKAVADGIAETVGLDQARGAQFERQRPTGRVQRLDGLAWLASRGRLTGRQLQAGRRYGRLVEVLEGGDLASCLTLFEVRTPGRGGSPTDGKSWARAKLAGARQAVGEHPALVFALDQVCGFGKRPREVTQNQRVAERLEDRLGLSLDLLVKAWGL